MCVYICIHTYMYVYINNIHIYIYIYIYVYIYKYVYGYSFSPALVVQNKECFFSFSRAFFGAQRLSFTFSRKKA